MQRCTLAKSWFPTSSMDYFDGMFPDPDDVDFGQGACTYPAEHNYEFLGYETASNVPTSSGYKIITAWTTSSISFAIISLAPLMFSI